MYKEFIKRDNVIAVVGASNNPEKWGYRVFAHLKKDGFRVFPVNPKDSEVLGEKCFHGILSVPERPDLVITVVRPEVTEKVVRECKDAGVKMVWMQPGSESKEAVVFCKDSGMEVVYNSCYVVDGLKEHW